MLVGDIWTRSVRLRGGVADSRMVSIALGRPLGVDDLDIDVPYPAEIDDAALLRVQHEDPPLADEAYSSTMSGFVSLTKLCRLAGRVAHVLYRPSNGRSVHESTWASNQLSQINKLDKLLKEWLEKDVVSSYQESALTAAQKVQGPRDVSFRRHRLGRLVQLILCRPHHAASKFPTRQPDFPQTQTTSLLRLSDTMRRRRPIRHPHCVPRARRRPAFTPLGGVLSVPLVLCGHPPPMRSPSA